MEQRCKIKDDAIIEYLEYKFWISNKIDLNIEAISNQECADRHRITIKW
jgi:hypothetical protein